MHAARKQEACNCCNKRLCAPDGGRVSILHANQGPAEQMKLAVRAGGHSAECVAVLGTQLASSGATQCCLWWPPPAALPGRGSNAAHQATDMQSRRCTHFEQGPKVAAGGLLCCPTRCSCPVTELTTAFSASAGTGWRHLAERQPWWQHWGSCHVG